MNSNAEYNAFLEHAERLIAIQSAATLALEESENLTDALTRILHSICQYLGWPFGAFWEASPDGGSLSCKAICPTHHASIDALVRQSHARVFPVGVGLPGQVLSQGNAIWLTDAAAEETFPRIAAFKEAELHTAVGIPLRYRDKIFGVYEFFSGEYLPRDDLLVKLMSSIGIQVGQFIHRHHTDGMLSEKQAAIEKSEVRVNAILNTALDAVIITDWQGLVTDWNRQAQIIFGWSHEEAIGKPMAELIIPHCHRGAHNAGMERFLKTGEKKILDRRIEITAINRSGKEFPVELTVTVQYDKGTPSFTAFIRDITSQQQAKRSLQQSEQRFRSVFNQQFQFMALLSPEGRVLDVNDLPLRATGISREMVMGRLFWETAWWEGLPEMQEKWPARLEAAAGSDQSIMSEDQYLAANAEVRTADAAITAVKNEAGEIAFFIVQATDTTERKRAETLLVQSEQRLRLMLESVRDYAIFSLDTSGHITTWNPGAQKMFGYSAEEIVSKHGSILFTPEDQTSHVPEQEILTAMENGRAEDERWHMRRSGERFFASGIMASIKSETGDLIGFVKIARDVTEQRKIEASLIEAREKAEAASIAKSEFLANMSHELRTPMNAVVGLANLLEMSRGNPARQQEFISTLKLSAQQLMDLINDLLDIAKLESHDVQLEKIPFTFTEIIAEIVSINAVKAKEKGIELINDQHCHMATRLIGDPLRLRQILMNIVGNAVKFTEKGSVTIRSHCETREGESLMEVKIDVIDTGIGIPPDKQKTIFSEFSQADTTITVNTAAPGWDYRSAKRCWS